MGRFNGKVAVVTGGNSGIGLASAKRLASEGARVAIFGRNQDTLDAAVEEVGEGAIGIQGDVTSMADLDKLVSTVSSELGQVDAVFVNAGVGGFTPLGDTTEEAFDHLTGVNFKGAYFTIQKLLPILNEGSSVVLNASVANQVGMPAFGVYSATKAAVRSLARTFSAELVDRGIRVNVVSPGPIETPIFDKMGMSQEQQGEFGEQITTMVPMKRMGQPEEIASAVAFLASSDSSYVVGAEIEVDGGMTQI
jgi:NAD(P)-dependent dehydrogenase (short-subunit alcohol dehydrogenase family)